MCDHLPMITCVQNPLYSRKIGEGDPSRRNLRFVTSDSRFALASSKYEAPEEEGAATVIYFKFCRRLSW